MRSELSPLFHWSRIEARDAIRREGLRPGSTSPGGFPLPHVCLAPDPRAAWFLANAERWDTEQRWDLWQVWLAKQDEIRVRAEYASIYEVKVHNPIPPDRLWFCGEREVWLPPPS